VSEYNYEYDELVQVGQEAQNLLQNPVFGMAYAAVLDDLQRRFFDTEPGHSRSLEEIRREGNALAKVVGHLNKAVLQAQTIIQQSQSRAES